MLRRLGSYSRQYSAYLALREGAAPGAPGFCCAASLAKPCGGHLDEQLDKLKSAHLFARAVCYGQSGQLAYAGQELEIAS